MEALLSHRLAALAFAAIALAAIACGSPDPEGREFAFTPVPYTPMARGDDCAVCGKAHSCTAAGEGYYSDQVLAHVVRSDENRFVELAESYGFKVLARLDNERRGTASVLIEVPAGSSVAAAALLADEFDVIDAEPHGYFSIPEATDRCPG